MTTVLYYAIADAWDSREWTAAYLAAHTRKHGERLVIG
jgi:hypothetical protein